MRECFIFCLNRQEPGSTQEWTQQWSNLITGGKCRKDYQWLRGARCRPQGRAEWEVGVYCWFVDLHLGYISSFFCARIWLFSTLRWSWCQWLDIHLSTRKPLLADILTSFMFTLSTVYRLKNLTMQLSSHLTDDAPLTVGNDIRLTDHSIGGAHGDGDIGDERLSSPVLGRPPLADGRSSKFALYVLLFVFARINDTQLLVMNLVQSFAFFRYSLLFVIRVGRADHKGDKGCDDDQMGSHTDNSNHHHHTRKYSCCAFGFSLVFTF